MTQKVPIDLMNVASQAEAQVGTAVDKVMTPLRAREGVNSTPGMAVHLQTLTANNSSELIFTGFNSALYDDYEIVISGLAPSSDGIGVLLRMSIDGGSTWRSVAGDYVHNAQALYDTSQAGGGVGATGASEIHLQTNVTGVGNAAREKLSGRFTLHNPGAGNGVQITGIFHYRKNDGGPVSGVMGGTYVGSADAVNGIRIFANTGTLASGFARIYGIRK